MTISTGIGFALFVAATGMFFGIGLETARWMFRRTTRTPEGK